MSHGVFRMTRPVMAMRMRAAMVYLRKHADRAVPAIELAQALQIGAEGGNREVKRRVVRKIVERLHADGMRICADTHPTQGGYWLARSDAEWRRYAEAKASGLRFGFVRIRKMTETARDHRSGQGRLAFAEC